MLLTTILDFSAIKKEKQHINRKIEKKTISFHFVASTFGVFNCFSFFLYSLLRAFSSLFAFPAACDRSRRSNKIFELINWNLWNGHSRSHASCAKGMHKRLSNTIIIKHCHNHNNIHFTHSSEPKNTVNYFAHIFTWTFRAINKLYKLPAVCVDVDVAFHVALVGERVLLFKYPHAVWIDISGGNEEYKSIDAAKTSSNSSLLNRTCRSR